MTGRSISDPLPLTHGVQQGSILGPILFLVIVADMQNFVLRNLTNAKMTGYADDSTAYVRAKNNESLKGNLEDVSSSMISYCQNTRLILNNNKTQLLVSTMQECGIKMRSSTIEAKLILVY